MLSQFLPRDMLSHLPPPFAKVQFGVVTLHEWGIVQLTHYVDGDKSSTGKTKHTKNLHYITYILDISNHLIYLNVCNRYVNSVYQITFRAIRKGILSIVFIIHICAITIYNVEFSFPKWLLRSDQPLGNLLHNVIKVSLNLIYLESYCLPQLGFKRENFLLYSILI